MPMFIYHYMILNIIVNVPARSGADGFLPYYIGDMGSAGQGGAGGFFRVQKTFRPLAASDFRGGWKRRPGVFFSKLGRIRMRQSFSIWKAVPEYGQGKRPEKAGGAKIKKVQIFTNLYQKFEDFEAKPFTKVIKICIMPEGSTVWASHIHMARRLTYTV